jgi:hypothetical protein
LPLIDSESLQITVVNERKVPITGLYSYIGSVGRPFEIGLVFRVSENPSGPLNHALVSLLK